MPIDPNIALGVKTPQFQSPVEALGKVAAYRNMIAETNLRQSEIADNAEKLKQQQIATAKAQRDQADGERVRQAFVQTDGDPDATVQQAIQNGAGPDAITGLQKHFTDLKKSTAEADKVTLENRAARNNQILPLIDQATKLATTNPQAYMQAWPQLYAQFNEIDPKTAQVARPDQPATPQELLTARALHMTDQYFVSQETQKRAGEDQIIKENDEARKEELQPSLVAEARGKASSETAQGQMKTQQAALMANYQPGQGPHPVDAVLPPSLDKTANAAFKSSFDFAMKSGGPEAAQKVLEAAGTHAASMSPEKIKSDVGKAVQTEIATSPIKISQAVQTEVQKARLAGGIGQIVDPQQRNEASRTLDAADKEAIDKISAADALKKTVQMAQAGNKVAPNLETIEELRSILPRINGRELQSVGSSGSAYDRLAGFVGKWTAGQPYDGDLQKDMSAVASGSQQLAQQKHKAAYGTVAARFGVKDLQPPDIAKIYSDSMESAPTASHGVPNVGDTFNGEKVRSVKKIQ